MGGKAVPANPSLEQVNPVEPNPAQRAGPSFPSQLGKAVPANPSLEQVNPVEPNPAQRAGHAQIQRLLRTRPALLQRCQTFPRHAERNWLMTALAKTSVVLLPAT